MYIFWNTVFWKSSLFVVHVQNAQLYNLKTFVVFYHNLNVQIIDSKIKKTPENTFIKVNVHYTKKNKSLIEMLILIHSNGIHDDVIKWKHFPRYWPFVRGINRSPVKSPHKGQWRGALMFTLICARKNGWVNNREAGDLRRHHAHYVVIVMQRLISGRIAMYTT